MVIQVDVCEETGDREGASFSCQEEFDAFLEEARRRLKKEISAQRRISNMEKARDKYWTKILDQML